MPDQLPGYIQDELNEFAVNFRVCLPGRIEKYDSKTHLAIVQPLLKRKFFGRKFYELLPTIANVPVVHQRSKKGIVKVPISKGSVVKLTFVDRSMESWVAGNGDPKEPDDTRKHHFNDCYAEPGGYPKQDPWPTSYPDALELEVKPGTKIAIGNGSVELLNIAYDAFSSLKDLADELSQTLSDLQLETHSTSSPGAPTGVPLNAASYAATKTNVDSITNAVDIELTKLEEIKP